VESSDHQARFGGISRLYGPAAAKRIAAAHVCVVGIGGVGSWAAEALARSGIAKLTLIDLDDICVSNINRQIHAFSSTVGQYKVDVMADRVRDIHPEIEIDCVRKFLTKDNAQELLDHPFDVVLDAIDNGKLKCHLLSTCRDLGIRSVTVGGAGGLRDPSKIRSIDLSRTYNDPLLTLVRKFLRRRHGWPRGKRKFRVPCIFSEELPVYVQADGTLVSRDDEGSDRGINCNTGLGTSATVTGAFGLHAAAAVIDVLIEEPTEQHDPEELSDSTSVDYG